MNTQQLITSQAVSSLLNRANNEKIPSRAQFLIETAGTLDPTLDIDEIKALWLEKWILETKRERGIQ